MDNILEDFKLVVKEHTMEGYDEFFTANAFMGEVGEFANARKKKRYTLDHPEIARKLVSRDYDENSIDEAGDTLFFLMQWLNKAGITLENAMIHQIGKLKRQSIEVGKTFKK